MVSLKYKMGGNVRGQNGQDFVRDFCQLRTFGDGWSGVMLDCSEASLASECYRLERGIRLCDAVRGI